MPVGADTVGASGQRDHGGAGLGQGLQVARSEAGQEDWVEQARQASRRELPVWELGVGVSAISLPDYRGAESRRRYLVPFPVFVYRARHLHVDRNGIRADLWDNRRLELDLSVGMSAPVRSDPDGVRAGMPRLRPLFELGPRLIAHLWSGDAGRQRLQLQLPLRLAMPLGKLQHAGWVLSPALHMQVDHVAGFRGWTLSGWAGPVFATRAYHQYYYRVSAEHARAGRPAYEASGGYGGMQYSLTLNKRYPDYWLAAFMRLDQVRGAVFEASPLVRRRSGLTAGLVFGWLFRRSAETVPQTQ
ncbi:MAG: MipA/OmpV family protein [Lautropia sp.]|nr:MipA/OmpV family protein [Lautropia sp.]